jgi:NADH:ubiquinone oxidoreductase subunit F (NADH-binding)/NADH:ubiquinone oxidoreductase subunit E
MHVALPIPYPGGLSPEQRLAIEQVLARFRSQPRPQSYLIPALTEIQAICGNWLPREALEIAAGALAVSYPKAYGVASFYTMFSFAPRGRYIIRCCDSPPCHIKGARRAAELLQGELGIGFGQTTADGLFTLEPTGCLGVCELSPAMQVNEVVWGPLDEAKVAETLALYREGQPPDYRGLPFSGGDYRTYPKTGDKLRLLANVGRIDPTSIDDYIKAGGYKGLKRALAMKPEEVVAEVKNSGLRGRGGAGFGAGLKWSFTAPIKGAKYIACNADEGEPGTIKDRYIMEGDPHRLLEGVTIAGYAVGAAKAYIYCRGEYYLPMHRLSLAIAQATERGFLGKKILRSSFDYEIEIRAGAGSYVCGEETGLINSIEGRRGAPRVRPPFPGVAGIWGRPTVVNNVETLSNVPSVLTLGAEGYKALGTQDTPGTKIFQVVGHVKRPCIVEAPTGLTIRELIENYGGGIREGHRFKMCQTGGNSFHIIPEALLDTPLEFGAMQKAGAMLGSGTMLVMDETTCVVDFLRVVLKFFEHENCGFCTPCRRGMRVLKEIYEGLAAGRGREEDLEAAADLARTMFVSCNCALAMSPGMPIQSSIKHFREEYLEHVQGKCPAGVCKMGWR